MRSASASPRRLDAEGIAIVLSMRTVAEGFAALPQLVLEGVGDDDARELLRLALPGAIDRRVRDQLIAESRGNPLALQELPLLAEPCGDGRRVPRSPDPYCLSDASSRVSSRDWSRCRSRPAGPAPARGRGPDRRPRAALAGRRRGPRPQPRVRRGRAGRRARRRHASRLPTSTRALGGLPGSVTGGARTAHAALADATEIARDPDRRAWHRASAALLPDEEVAADLERSAARARTRVARPRRRRSSSGRRS